MPDSFVCVSGGAEYLACPPRVARLMPKSLQEMIGYTMAAEALGYYANFQ